MKLNHNELWKTLIDKNRKKNNLIVRPDVSITIVSKIVRRKRIIHNYQENI